MKALLEAALRAAISAADTRTALPPLLPEPTGGRLLVVGAGKAAELMAQAVHHHYASAYPGSPVTGLVIAPQRGPGADQGLAAASDTGAIRVLTGAHPVPDEHGERATRELMQLVRELRPGDRLLVLLSGGGSALMTAPAHVTLERKAELTRHLLGSGLDIGDMNTVRKHLSHVKGGRLALLAAERQVPVLTLAVSDVVGDDPATIASGPTVADPSTYRQALELVQRHAPGMTDVEAVLERGAAGMVEETPKPGDGRLAASRYFLVADPAGSLMAAGDLLRQAGVSVVDLGVAVEGEAHEVGAQHAALLLSHLQARPPAAGPLALLSGGELTVTLRGPAGWGGPNGEYALGFAAALGVGPLVAHEAGHLGTVVSGTAKWQVYLLAADTDGVDGGGAGTPAHSVPAAGALLGPDEFARLDPDTVAAALQAHNAHGLLREVGGLLTTGPTFTNVNDLRLALAVPTDR